MHIFLLGFMGSGKSHWGRIWASAFEFNFIDLDEEIENRERQSVTALFENNGENYFRMKEAEVLRSLGLEPNTIISCGGGCPCFFENMAWMNANGVTVLLNALPKHIFNNLKKGKAKRPLLKDKNDEELLFFIEQKLKERLPVYKQAKIILDAGSLNSNSFKAVKNFHS